MNDRKQKQLFEAARRSASAEIPSDFSASVLRAVRRDEQWEQSASVFDQLAGWFPRLATAALVIMVVALAFEFYVDGDLTSQVAELSDQWLFPVDWL